MQAAKVIATTARITLLFIPSVYKAIWIMKVILLLPVAIEWPARLGLWIPHRISGTEIPDSLSVELKGFRILISQGPRSSF